MEDWWDSQDILPNVYYAFYFLLICFCQLPKNNFSLFSCQIVLSGFVSGELPLQLTTNMFQNIFPTIDVKTVSFADT